MKISVVIRCYNEEKYIGRLLDGIAQQSETDLEIIVVDSGSTDNTLNILSNYPVKLLTIPKEEFSFGRSLNIGCEAATGEIVVAASAHVYPMYQDWLEHLTSPFADPQIALTYGRQQGDDTTKYSEHRVLAKWFPERSNLDQQHPFCNNANAAIRRSVFEQIKYDESLTGLEDTDWARRAMLLGHKIGYTSDTPVIHVHDESSTQTYNRYRREAIALKRIFPQERFSLLEFVRLFTANVASDYRHAVRDGVFRSNWPSIFIFRFMQFWGTYKGFTLEGPISSQLKSTFYYPTRRPSPEAPATTGSRRRVKYTDDTVENQVDRSS